MINVGDIVIFVRPYLKIWQEGDIGIVRKVDPPYYEVQDITDGFNSFVLKDCLKNIFEGI